MRAAGGIARAVEAGTLTRGIMHACVKQKVEFLLTGSIRDDGPLPEVVTDSMEAQRLIREKIEDVRLALLMGTMFHSIAVANLLPGSVKTLAVDINPAVVAKLTDQQTFRALGLVTDIEPFMRELTECLKTLREGAKISRSEILMRELLLCAPDYYGIEYQINPWMSRARGAETDLAKAQWQGLHETLASLEAKIELVPPQPKLPDMVFTANAGLTVGKKFIPSNFRHQERAGEAPHFVRWMEEHGYEIAMAAGKPVFRGRRRRALRRRRTFLRLQIPSAIFNRIARSRICLAASSFRSSWSIRVFTISTPAFVRCPMAVRSGFRRRLTNMGSAPFATTCRI